MLWLQVPSTFPMTGAEAYTIACRRWSIDNAEARSNLLAEGVVGIEYPVDNSTAKVSWAELPPASRRVSHEEQCK